MQKAFPSRRHAEAFGLQRGEFATHLEKNTYLFFDALLLTLPYLMS